MSIIKKPTKEELKRIKEPYKFVVTGDIKKLKKFLETCENINMNDTTSTPPGKTMLHYAAEYGQLEAVKLICARNPKLNLYDTRLPTPLALALLNYCEAVALALLSYGADPYIESPPEFTNAITMSASVGKRFELLFREECDKRQVRVAVKVKPAVQPAAIVVANEKNNDEEEKIVVGEKPLPKGFRCPPPGEAVLDAAALKRQNTLHLKAKTMRILQQQRALRRAKIDKLEELTQKCHNVLEAMGDWTNPTIVNEAVAKAPKPKPDEENSVVKGVLKRRATRLQTMSLKEAKENEEGKIGRSASIFFSTPRFKTTALVEDQQKNEEAFKLIQVLRAWTEYDIPVPNPIPSPENSLYKIDTKAFQFPMIVNGKLRESTTDSRTLMVSFSRYLCSIVVALYQWNDGGYSKKTFSDIFHQINDYANGFLIHHDYIKDALTPEASRQTLSEINYIKEAGMECRDSATRLKNNTDSILKEMGNPISRLVGASVWLLRQFIDRSSIEFYKRSQEFVQYLLSDRSVKLYASLLSFVNVMVSITFSSSVRSTGLNIARSWFNLAKMARDAQYENFQIDTIKEPVRELLQDMNDFITFDIASRRERTPENNRDETLLVKESVRLLMSAVDSARASVPTDHYLSFSLEALVLKLPEIDAIADRFLNASVKSFENKEFLNAVMTFAETSESFLKFFAMERSLDIVVHCIGEFTAEFVMASTCYALANNTLPRHHVATSFRALCYALTASADIIACTARESE